MPRRPISMDDTAAIDDADAENAYIEQAEYIARDDFLAWSAEHPQEASILRRLSAGGAKLLSGPRGCGKTTLLLKAYHGMLRSTPPAAFPVYVNFKLSLRLEPLYLTTANASFWFRRWLIAKIYEATHETIETAEIDTRPMALPARQSVRRYLELIEAGNVSQIHEDCYTTDNLEQALLDVAQTAGCSRCVLLLDDAAHAFSPKQQEDFFDFFRSIKSRHIAPKAAVYPGITTHSPNFHVGHDAEQIDAWIRPDTPEYLLFMRSLAAKRFSEVLPPPDANTTDAIDFLAYAAFGVPRSFLNMIRSLHLGSRPNQGAIDRRELLNAAKLGREAAHNVYESLVYKLPMYRNFVRCEATYANILNYLKDYNRLRDEGNQALEVGIKRPIPPDLAKIMSFFQYAGLLMPVGENSRGVKGVFDLYMVHFGDLVTENTIIGRRAKSVSSFVAAFKAQTHQAWPRISTERLIDRTDSCAQPTLSLPNCQRCGASRQNEDARFCQNCGAELKMTSLYDELVMQDISVLPITKRRSDAIKDHSNIRTVRDILIDSSRQALRGVPYVGEVWSERIAHYAEEHVA